MKRREDMKEYKIGDYYNYNDCIYQILGFALHPESLQDMIIYKGIEDEIVWVYSLDFFERRGFKKQIDNTAGEGNDCL
jgi:hypothetical protein